MPSPVGHALGGLALGWLAVGPRKLDRPVLATLLFAALAVLPDVDVLVEGTHRLYTHSLVATAIAGLTVGAIERLGGLVRLGIPPGRLALACAAAYGSHVLLDWLADDRSVPIGIRALWPFSDAFVQSSLRLFPPVERRWWLPGFWTANLRAIGWELLLLAPIVALVCLARARTRGARSQ